MPSPAPRKNARGPAVGPRSSAPAQGGARGPGGETGARPPLRSDGLNRASLLDPRELAPAVLLLASVFLAACHTLIDPDIWFHLRAGGDIAATRSIPRVDTFSYPSAGRPYIDLHWLFQLVMAWIHRAGGAGALTLTACFAVTLSFLLMYLLARRNAPALLAAPLALLGAVLASERFEPRPEIFSFLFLALTFWLIRRHSEGDRRALFFLPAVFLLWVNSEGLFVLGYLVFAAELVDRPHDRKLLLAAAGCVAVSVINPYFLTGAVHPLVLFTRINSSLPIYSATIGEFLSPFRGPALHPSVALFPFYLGLIGAGLLLCWKWPRRSEVILLAAFIYLSLSARRNLALLGLAATPVLSRWFEAGRARLEGNRAWRKSPERRRRGVVLGAAAAFFLAVLWYDLSLLDNRLYRRAETNRTTGTGIAPVAFASEAARFLRENRVDGPLFSTFATGSYFTYALPEQKVFIDGRLEVHSAEHYARYLQMLQGGEAWKSAERQYGFNAAVIQYMEAMPLAVALLRDASWVPVHLDDTALIFVKRSPKNERIIAAHEMTPAGLHASFPVLEKEALTGAPALPPVPPALVRLFRSQPFPWGSMNLGGLFAQFNRQELAYPQFLKAVQQAPGLAGPRLMLAASLNQMGRAGPALEVLDSSRGCEASRSSRSRGFNIRGDILVSLQHPAEAVEAYTRYLRDPSSPEQVPAVLASRAFARREAGDLEGAFQDVDASLRRQPANPQAWWILGSVEEARGHREVAIRAYQKFQSMGGRSPEVDSALRRLGAQ